MMYLKYQNMEFDDLSIAPGVPGNILEVVPLEYHLEKETHPSITAGRQNCNSFQKLN